MKCSACKWPIHEQFKGHLGHWYCFHGGYAGCICDTPVKEWNDFPANNKRLAEAETPTWCPLKEKEQRT